MTFWLLPSALTLWDIGIRPVRISTAEESKALVRRGSSPREGVGPVQRMPAKDRYVPRYGHTQRRPAEYVSPAALEEHVTRRPQEFRPVASFRDIAAIEIQAGEVGENAIEPGKIALPRLVADAVVAEPNFAGRPVSLYNRPVEKHLAVMRQLLKLPDQIGFAGFDWDRHYVVFAAESSGRLHPILPISLVIDV
jgi:hypothetical protein